MEKKLYELTNPQKSILLTEEFYKGSNINNICGTAIIDDVLDFDLLKKAMQTFVKNHDSFNMKLVLDNNEMKQYIDDVNNVDIEIVDIDSKDDISKIENNMLNHVFDIYNGDLFCMKIFRLKDNTGGFVVNVHHLFGDSWTLGIVANDIVRIYSCLLNGEDVSKNDDFSYIDYIYSEREYLSSDKCSKDKEYWNSIYSTIPEQATIPSTITELNDEFSCKAERQIFNIDNAMMNKINDFCKLNHVSVFNFFMAIYSIYIGRVSRIDDFVIGTPILNRTNFKEKNTTGMFINTAPLRVNIDDNLDFKSFASNIAKDCLGMLRHQKYYYQSILEDLRKDNPNLPNLYNVLISYQVTKANTEKGLSYNTRWCFNGCISDDIDIHLFDLNDTGSLNIAYDYKLAKYTENDVEDLHNRILHMINQVINCNDILLKNIEIVTSKEKYQILYNFNNTDADYPTDKTIIDLFEEQVEKTPDNIAVVFENQKLTYRELNEKANQLARYLVDIGISNNSIVGIMLPRSIEIMISFLGVLKSGACYIPIDPDYPIDRISYMLEDSDAKLLISLSNTSKSLSCRSSIINLDTLSKELLKYSTENLSKHINSSDLAYIIYTSGSTGKPKGVKLKHLSLSNLIHYCNNYVEYLKNNKYRSVVSVTTASFDIFIFETLISLQRGLKLVIANEKEQNIPTCLDELIARENIEIIQTTPSRMQLFYSNIDSMPHFNYLKFITLAGEQLPISLVKNLKSVTDCLVYNGYGPSETTVFATFTDVTNKKKITIGKPLPNTQIYILNQNDQLCPIGVPGEICISGAGVGYGYINKDEMTKKSFVKNPFIPSSIMYKTGDLGYYDSNGEIFCLGRLDHQVKIRGLRIELEEIEKVLLNIANITRCTVKKDVDDNGHEFLCAYFVTNGSININDIKNILYKKLPNYMVPQYFMELKELPYTPNGKIDKKRLPTPKVEKSKKTVIARNNLDTILIDIFKDLLKVQDLGIEDSLYDLGGDSLTSINLATAVYNKLGIAISIKDIFSHPTIKELSDYISSLSKTTDNSIKPAKKMDNYPLSSAQRRIYYASSIDSNSVLYNIAGGIIVDKTLDIKLLQKCFQTLIDRHEVLRTHFNLIEDDIVQIVEDKIDFVLSSDTSTSDDLNSIYTDFVKPFDLAKAPLFRAKAVSLSNNKMLLLLDMHHIISDGTSLGILLQELCDLYNGNVLPEKQVDYKDFTLWEKEQFEKDEFKHSKEYWVNQFKDEIPLLNMPTTFTRPSVQSFEGSNYYAILPKEVFKNVNEVAKSLGVTPYMLMLSVYYILLSKYTSQDDIIVGTPVIGRELPELSNMLGMFVNTLALRNKVKHSASFSEFANEIKEYCLSAFENQTYPFDELVKELKIKRDTSRNPLFDVMFIYQNNGYPDINFKDANTEYFVPDSKISKFDLSLEIIPMDNEFSLRFEYCTKLFDEDFIKRLSSHYINILNAVLDNSDIKIADIDMLSTEERNQILYDFNNTTRDYPRDKTIVDLFEEQVEKKPDNIAVVFEDKQLTYRELNEKSNKLASKLYANGIRVGDVVGVCLNRSPELIVSICAIFKLGAIYMPMYVNYPKDRLDYMLKNSAAKLLITNSNMKELVEFNNIILDSINNIDYPINNNFNEHFSPDAIAYIIYTSGSTGKPKGVQISNRNLINFVYAFKQYYGEVTDKDIFLASTNISFDVSIFELFLPLLSGSQLVLHTEEIIKDISLYCDTIVNNKITALYIPPNILNEVYSILKDKELNINKMLVGVEAIKKSTLNRYLQMIPNLKIVNGYGPTETTICCTALPYTYDDTNDEVVSIGRPLFNNQIFILSSDKNLQPVGVLGEIYVAGDGVGHGYINDEEKTSKNYIDNIYSSSSNKMYKTGDLAKWNSDGTIDFVGRNDSQVKISGHRIELKEINYNISLFPHIDKAYSTTYKLGHTVSIVSYFTADKDISITDLNAFLKQKLADFMVPNFIMQIDSFPLTANGKIDKENLPKNFVTLSNGYVAPRNEFENNLAQIWSSLLGINKIGINDNFFDLGGDSLIAIKLQAEAINIGLNITYADIFTYPTIKQLSEKNTTNNEVQYSDKNYDYSKIDALISKNSIENIAKNKIHTNPIGNILLVGATGFLGAHILDNYLSNETGVVYCLIRVKDTVLPETRLKKALNFYFGNKYDNLFGKRIIVVNGDITDKQFCLSKQEYNSLGKQIDVVINSAALVKHYGDYQLFNDTNVVGTSNIIKFCEEYNKKFYHISTISVSGSGIYKGGNINDRISFKENNFYIDQDLNNVYIYTKFEAEKLIFEEILSGRLSACILRIGNISNRFSDGKFQINVSENAFASKMKAIYKLGVIQKVYLEHSLEFTPVDYCSDAIMKIVASNPDFSVFHLFNSNLIRIDTLLNYLRYLDINISPVDNNEFSKTIKHFLSSEELRMDITGIIADLDKNKLLNTIVSVLSNADFTEQYLNKIGFEWPKIELEYITKYINYFNSINFFD